MPPSVYQLCLTKTRDKLFALGIRTDGGVLLGVDIAKLPTAGEQIDPLPLLRIHPSNRVVVDRPFSTATLEGGPPTSYREYMAGIVIIERTLMDRKKDMFSVLSARQQIARAMGGSRPIDVDELMTTKFFPDLLFNPRAYNLSYNYSAMAVRFCCVEPSYG